eukprot:TRINITY_DN3391_c0_g1_i2.p1 TRINITY_DN3391_c0_g1~~TRINITY_DN3391_c0_g1_i2.p1  ORF type:complete len:277 (+),score=84.85 TRINITY_DN3391_c0_g1_i2:176-1006(+)
MRCIAHRACRFHSELPMPPLAQHTWFAHVAHVHTTLRSRVHHSRDGILSVLRRARPWDPARLHMIDHAKTEIEVANHRGETALHVAVEKRDVEAVQRLVAHCTNVDARTNQSLSPLHMAAKLGYSNIAKVLVELGRACLSVRSVGGMSPLHVAAQAGHADIVRYFIEQHGANANERDGVNSTPLHLAVQCGRREVVRVLVDLGADVLAQDARHQTPRSIAQVMGQASIVHLFQVVLMFTQHIGAHYHPASKAGDGPVDEESLYTNYCADADWVDSR